MSNDFPILIATQQTPKSTPLFLAWQDPISRYWFTIGRLTFEDGTYQFFYTEGVIAIVNPIKFHIVLTSIPIAGKISLEKTDHQPL